MTNTAGSWVSVDSNLECYTYKMNNSDQNVDDCNLFIKSAIEGNSYAAFQIERSTESSKSTSNDVYTSFLTYSD